jgi:hypothetical protein
MMVASWAASMDRNSVLTKVESWVVKMAESSVATKV